MEIPDHLDPAPENLVEIGSYRSWAEGAERGLVVLAMQQPYWLVMTDGAAKLLVETTVAEKARQELRQFEREASQWPPRTSWDTEAPAAVDVITPMLWAMTVLALFRAQLEWPGVTATGLLDPSAIFREGEWWRLLTALFLHGDAAHVLANVMTGLLAFTALLTTFGTVRGWLLVAASSIAANLTVAGIRVASPYQSLGASTAIFAALGLLTGRAIRHALAARHPHRWRSIFVPLGTGLIVLALYGAGGLNVDVGAHAMGFASGVVTGYAVGPRRLSR